MTIEIQGRDSSEYGGRLLAGRSIASRLRGLAAAFALGSLLAALALPLVSASGLQIGQRDKSGRKGDSDTKDKSSAADLQKRVAKAEDALLKEYLDVANEFYKQGDKELAIEVLRRVEKINPQTEGLKTRIAAIEEELLQANGLKFKLDVARGWTPVCSVEREKPIRIRAAGDYKLEYETTVPVTGLSSANPATDHVSAGAFGALIGVVVTNGKPGEAFAINGGTELEPKDSGQLLVRVNVPVTARCKGEIELELSGAVQPVSKKLTP
jgi:hypothetical protein